MLNATCCAMLNANMLYLGVSVWRKHVTQLHMDSWRQWGGCLTVGQWPWRLIDRLVLWLITQWLTDFALTLGSWACFVSWKTIWCVKWGFITQSPPTTAPLKWSDIGLDGKWGIIHEPSCHWMADGVSLQLKALKGNLKQLIWKSRNVITPKLQVY